MLLLMQYHFHMVHNYYHFSYAAVTLYHINNYEKYRNTRFIDFKYYNPHEIVCERCTC
jgi:hypothetical protein